jgi:hypothetical protein
MGVGRLHGPAAPAGRRREGRGPQRPRPERWGRHEGVQLAFSRFAGFELHDESLRWEFAGAEAVWEELAAPPGPLAVAARRGRLPVAELRDRLLRLVEAHGHDEGDRLVLPVAYVLVIARKPQWVVPPVPTERRDARAAEP